MTLEPGAVNAETGDVSDMMERLDQQAKSKPPIRDFSEAVFFENVFSSTSLPLSGDKPLLYTVPGLKNYIIDMSLIKHYARFRIVDSNGQSLTVSDQCVVKGSPLYSPFKHMHITWNGTTVFNSKNLYNQYVNLLQKIKDVKLLPEMISYYDDTEDMLEGAENTFDLEDSTKVVGTKKIWDGEDAIKSWNNRTGSWRYGNTVEVLGPLLFDQIFQSRFLRDDIEMRISMNTARPELALFTSQPERGFRLELMESHLIVPRFKLKLKYSLPRGKLNYYYVQHEISTHTLAKGVQTVQRQLRSGNLPRRIYFVMISEDAFLGSYHHSPYRYQPFKLQYFQVTCGSRKFPSEPIRMEWGDDRRFSEAYQWFLTNSRSSKRLGSGAITKEMFRTSNFFLAVDLTPDLSAGSDYRVQIGTSPLNLAMQFESGLPQNIIILMMEEFESTIECSPHGQVMLRNYGSD